MPKRVQVQGDYFHGVIPDGATYVGRGAPRITASPYANNHKVGTCRCGRTHNDRAEALAHYRTDLEHSNRYHYLKQLLAGRDLACWCALSDPCHADLLLKIANAEGEEDASSS
jgi:Domain of unknown function (DUF4326)